MPRVGGGFETLFFVGSCWNPGAGAGRLKMSPDEVRGHTTIVEINLHSRGDNSILNRGTTDITGVLFYSRPRVQI